MSTRTDNRETLAIRAAYDAFAKRLNAELAGLTHAEFAELDGSRHEHVSLLVSSTGPTFVVLTIVQFTSDPKAVHGALRLAKDGPAS